MPEPWIAHDHPERPLAFGAWLCDCRPCWVAVQAAAVIQPELEVVVKSDLSRRRLPIRRLAAVGQRPTAEALLTDPADRVREVYVAA